MVNAYHMLRVDREDRRDVPLAMAKKLLDEAEPHVKEVDCVVLSDYDRGAITSYLINGIVASAKAAGKITVGQPKMHHYIDFSGRWFSVRGPSITPRPPQGQPVVAALAHARVPYQLVAESTDIGFVTPHDARQARAIVAEIRALQERFGRAAETVHVVGDLLVYLDDQRSRAEQRRARLDELAGIQYQSDALSFAGTPAELADLLLEWQQAGLTGFRLRPATIPHDLVQITRALVPGLRQRRAFPDSYSAPTLRGLLGLQRPANRYASAS